MYAVQQYIFNKGYYPVLLNEAEVTNVCKCIYTPMVDQEETLETHNIFKTFL